MVTLNIKNDGFSVSAELNDFCEIDEVLNMLCILLEGAGWHRNTIESAIIDRADRIRQEDDRATDTGQED